MSNVPRLPCHQDMLVTQYANRMSAYLQNLVTGGGTGTGSKIMNPYAFADYPAGSVLIGVVPAGRTVQTVYLFVDTPFNNGVRFTVGDTVGMGRYFTLVDSDPTQVELYSVESGYTYPADTEVRIYFVGATPPTVGTGRVIVFYA